MQVHGRLLTTISTLHARNTTYHPSPISGITAAATSYTPRPISQLAPRSQKDHSAIPKHLTALKIAVRPRQASGASSCDTFGDGFQRQPANQGVGVREGPNTGACLGRQMGPDVVLFMVAFAEPQLMQPGDLELQLAVPR